MTIKYRGKLQQQQKRENERHLIALSKVLDQSLMLRRHNRWRVSEGRGKRDGGRW